MTRPLLLTTLVSFALLAGCAGSEIRASRFPTSPPPALCATRSFNILGALVDGTSELTDSDRAIVAEQFTKAGLKMVEGGAPVVIDATYTVPEPYTYTRREKVETGGVRDANGKLVATTYGYQNVEHTGQGTPWWSLHVYFRDEGSEKQRVLVVHSDEWGLDREAMLAGAAEGAAEALVNRYACLR